MDYEKKFYKKAWENFHILGMCSQPSKKVVEEEYRKIMSKDPTPIMDSWDMIKEIAELG